MKKLPEGNNGNKGAIKNKILPFVKKFFFKLVCLNIKNIKFEIIRIYPIRPSSESISKCLVNSSCDIFVEDIHKFLPRDIEVTIKVNSITNVEVKNYTYTIDFVMMLDWTDCTLYVFSFLFYNFDE